MMRVSLVHDMVAATYSVESTSARDQDSVPSRLVVLNKYCLYRVNVGDFRAKRRERMLSCS